MHLGSSFRKEKNHAPWITEETKELIRKRDKWKRISMDIAQQGGDSTCHSLTQAWSQYKKYRNKINNRKRNEENQYKSIQIKNSLASTEKTWNTAKAYMGWQQHGPPSQLEEGGILVSKSFDIASHVNCYFVQKIQQIREGLGNVAPNFETCKSIMKDKNCKLSMKYVTTAKVMKLIKKLKNSKSTSYDGIDNYSVKLSANIIAEPLHHIICLSIMQKKFPKSWKLVKVVPLHKKGSILDKKNYRPVALLSPFGKILEKIMYEHIFDYFTKNSVFHDSLHGYRQHRSTQSALIQMYDRWLDAASRKQVSGVILLDLSAAFDLVDHDILDKKLEIYGLDHEFREWIRSYLYDRKQSVWINHCYSHFLNVDAGVPQGSNLGPLFFLIFYNDLPHALSCNVEAYADDSTLSATGNTEEEISEILTLNCEAVSLWMHQNKLKLNKDKTHILTVGTDQRLRQANSAIEVQMGGLRLVESDSKCEQLLGVYIQSNLKWHQNISSLQDKLQKRLAGLWKLKFILPFSTLKTVIEGIFTSTVLYCLPVFGGCEKKYICSIQVLQNKAARIATRAPPRFNRKLLFDRLKWLSVNQLIAYHTLLTVFKIRNSGHPKYIADKLRRDNQYGRIILPKYNLELVEKGFVIRGSRLWNSLPPNLRAIDKHQIFKGAIKQWTYESIPRFLD